MPELTDQEKIDIATANGIDRAGVVMRICREIDLAFYIACAYLEQESAGGANVFGSDTGKPGLIRGVDLIRATGNKDVTLDRYRIYRMQRDDLGSQGVGPLQLTHWTLQDRADNAGGCWDPIVNTEIGLTVIKEYKDAGRTWDEVALRWNGGENYVTHNRELRIKWRERLAA